MLVLLPSSDELPIWGLVYIQSEQIDNKDNSQFTFSRVAICAIVTHLLLIINVIYLTFPIFCDNN